MKNVLNTINGDNDMKNNNIGVYYKNNGSDKNNSEELQGWELALAQAEKEGSPLQKRERERVREPLEKMEREATNMNDAREAREGVRETVTGGIEGAEEESSPLTIGTSKARSPSAVLQAKAMLEGFISAENDEKEGYSVSHSDDVMAVDGYDDQEEERVTSLIISDVTHDVDRDCEGRVEHLLSLIFDCHDIDGADTRDIDDTNNIPYIHRMPRIGKRDVNDGSKNYFRMNGHTDSCVSAHDPQIILEQRYVRNGQNRDTDNSDFFVLEDGTILGDRDETDFNKSGNYEDNSYAASQEARNHKYFPSEKCLFDLLTVKIARTILLQKLDGRRCGSGRLSGRGFACMTLLMKVSGCYLILFPFYCYLFLVVSFGYIIPIYGPHFRSIRRAFLHSYEKESSFHVSLFSFSPLLFITRSSSIAAPCQRMSSQR